MVPSAAAGLLLPAEVVHFLYAMIVGVVNDDPRAGGVETAADAPAHGNGSCVAVDGSQGNRDAASMRHCSTNPDRSSGKDRACQLLEAAMNGRRILKIAGRGVVAGGVAAAAGYAALVVLNRAKYGDAKWSAEAAKDPVLDRYIPSPEVAEHHHIKIHAPADVVMAAAKGLELTTSPMIRAIFKARELALGGAPDTRPHPTTLFDQMLSIGWVVLSEQAGREIVFGAVTQPWVAAPTFRSIPEDQFRDFREPGFVKIVWTLRAEPVDEERSIFHTETRVSTTDAGARERFRKYWSFVAPGVKLIRVAMLQPLRRAAEQRVRAEACC
jgi:hypothetical protein